MIENTEKQEILTMDASPWFCNEATESKVYVTQKWWTKLQEHIDLSANLPLNCDK